MPDGYFAGMIDAQLAVAIAKNNSVRVLLSSNDGRLADQIRQKFGFTRITTVTRPNKKDVCTCLFLGDEAKALLEYAAEHCLVKKQLAITALACIAGTSTVNDLRNRILQPVDQLPDVSLDWASGFFDVRGIIVPPISTGDQKRKASVKMVLPKTEKFIIPALQKVLSGKVKKSSPCRLVFESKDSIKAFAECVRGRVRAKESDLDTLVTV
jgi:hypothetical protein